jgi:hypothetical protein
VAVTKNTLTPPNKQYQQWDNGDFSGGDVLDVKGSLGGRSGRSVTLEVSGGDAVIQFNTVVRVFKSQENVGNTHISNSAFFPSAQLAAELQEARPDVLIEDGSVARFEGFPIDDIYIVTKSPLMRVTVL